MITGDGSSNKQRNYYQCIHCGDIHVTNTDKVWDLGDNIYYASYCPCCRKITKHLWVGEEQLDVYELADSSLDERWFNTTK